MSTTAAATLLAAVRGKDGERLSLSEEAVRAFGLARGVGTLTTYVSIGTRVVPTDVTVAWAPSIGAYIIAAPAGWGVYRPAGIGPD